MKTAQSANPGRHLLIFLVLVAVIFILTSNLFNGDSAVRSREVLEERLEQERDALSRTCNGLRNINQALDSGSYSFLGESLLTLEELVMAGQSLSCLALRSTDLILEKIRRLES